MNVRALLSIAMAFVWLGLGLYLLITYPQLRQPFAGDSRIAIGWMMVLLMTFWNLARAAMAWRRAQSESRVDGDTR